MFLLSFVGVSLSHQASSSHRSKHTKDKQSITATKSKDELSTSSRKKELRSGDSLSKSENLDKTKEKQEADTRTTEEAEVLPPLDLTAEHADPLTKRGSRRPMRNRSLSLGASGRKLVIPSVKKGMGPKRSSLVNVIPSIASRSSPVTPSASVGSDLTLSSSGGSDIIGRGKSASREPSPKPPLKPRSYSSSSSQVPAISPRLHHEHPDPLDLQEPVPEREANEADFVATIIPDYYKDYFVGKGNYNQLCNVLILFSDHINWIAAHKANLDEPFIVSVLLAPQNGKYYVLCNRKDVRTSYKSPLISRVGTSSLFRSLKSTPFLPTSQ